MNLRQTRAAYKKWFMENSAIAEKCGWRRAKGSIESWWAPSWMWYKPGEEIPKQMKVFSSFPVDLPDSTDLNQGPPDYEDDLNAIHEAEKFFTEDEFSLYCKNLHEMFCPHKCSSPTCGYAISATSEQRVKAYLAAIKNNLRF